MNEANEADAIATARRMIGGELSALSRIGHGLLLAAALGMTTILVALLLTEADVPLRTRAAFGVMALMGLAWAGYAAWILTQRRALFGRQRVIAGWMALAFSSVFCAAALAIGVIANAPAGLAAAGLGVTLVAGSLILLARARDRVTVLLARQQMLEAAKLISTQ